MKDEGGNRRRGFSLVEIMIVVVIIGLMAGLITYATSGYLARAKAQRAKSDLRTLAGAVDSFYGQNSRFPTNQEGLKVLVGPYIQVLQNDPWGRPYLYVQPGRGGMPFEIVTYGADGREGGTGADADLTNNDADVVAAPKK
jgi:general secretion pathway protein G